MTNNHPLRPSSEQVKQWMEDWHNAKVKHDDIIGFVADQAAQWASDEELNACRLWVSENCSIYDASDLRTARRPPLPSSKEVALKCLQTIERDDRYLPNIINAIRNALNQLPE
jgi:hypothetical protein